MKLFSILIFLFLTNAHAQDVNPKYLSECMEKRIPQSCELVGWIHYSKSEWVKAEEFYDKACQLNWSDGCRMAAHSWARQGNHEKFKDGLGAACKMKNATACDDVKKMESILASYRKEPPAAQSIPGTTNDVTSRRNAAEALYRTMGHDDLRKSFEANRRVVAEACKIKKPDQCLLLGRMNLAEPNYKESLNGFKTACELELPEGCHEAGKLTLWMGEIDAGKELIGRSCDKKFEPACKTLNTIAKYEQSNVEFLTWVKIFAPPPPPAPAISKCNIHRIGKKLLYDCEPI